MQHITLSKVQPGQQFVVEEENPGPEKTGNLAVYEVIEHQGNLTRVKPVSPLKGTVTEMTFQHNWAWIVVISN